MLHKETSERMLFQDTTIFVSDHHRDLTITMSIVIQTSMDHLDLKVIKPKETQASLSTATICSTMTTGSLELEHPIIFIKLDQNCTDQTMLGPDVYWPTLDLHS